MDLHVSFDLDGTLLNSNKIINQALKQALKDLDYKMNFNTNMAISLDGLIKVIDIKKEKDRNILKKKFIYYYDNYLCTLSPLYPCVFKVLNFLKNNNIYLTIVTNKRKLPTYKILKRHKIYNFFSEIYCLGDIKYTSKDKILKKIYKYNLRNIYIGDLLNDKKAAELSNYEFILAKNMTRCLKKIDNFVKSNDHNLFDVLYKFFNN